MTSPQYDLLAIGNAIVDVLAQVPEDFLKNNGDMPKGSMTLIDEERALALYDAMPPALETSGGSAGNTMAGFASFGGQGAYIGKVSDDQLGTIFRHDMQAQGVQFDTAPLSNGPATARCFVLVTPDGERTMNTYLGACTTLTPEDISSEIVSTARITYMEGYLFDEDHAKAAFRHAAKIAEQAGQQVALTLSDSFCVDRHRDDFRDLVENHVDILFANEDEIKNLYETDSFEGAVSKVRGHCAIAALTRGEKGATLLSNDKQIDIPAAPVEKVMDATGAGDQFAAGVLYGLTQDLPLEQCGQLGALAAAEVIQHMGPRPEIPYAGFVEKVAA